MHGRRQRTVTPMATVARIAVNVFRDSVRDKVLYNLVLFAMLMIAASLLLGQLTAGQEVKIIKDLGLAAMSVFGLFIAMFIGIGLVSKEVERRSIYALLVKPISRPQFVIGKFCGLVLTLAVNVAVMSRRSTWCSGDPVVRGRTCRRAGSARARSGAAEGDLLIFANWW